MKQIIQSYKTGQMELVEVPEPLCQDNGVLVETQASLISVGTEKQMIELAKKSLAAKAKARPDLVKQVLHKVKTEGLIETAKKVFAKLDNPINLGYSCASCVIAVGKNIDEFKIGDRVACAGTDYASHAQVNYVPRNLCIKIPDGVSFQEAAFTTLGAIALQGIRRCDLAPGEKVGVIGLGLIGQLTTQILLAYGFPVLGIDINERKVKTALSLGLSGGAVIGRDSIKEAALAFSSGQGLDAVIITAATSSNEPVELTGEICRLGGRVSVVGLVGTQIPRELYYKKELDFRLSRSYGPGRYDSNYEEKGNDYPYAYVRWTEKRNMEEFLRLVGAGKVNVKSMITHKFKIDDYEKAYNLILENPNREDFYGVLLEYDTHKEHKTVIIQNDQQKSSPEKRIETGIIGAGNFARSILLPNLKKVEGINLKAVATASGVSAQNIGKKYGCQYCTTDYHKILDDPKINTIFVATRHNLHASIVIEAMQKGKNVFVEKPFCLTKEELKQIVSLPKSKILMVGFNRRFAPQAVSIKKKFSNSNTPLLINYRINAGYIPADHWVHDPKEGGGRIIGEVCHFVDLLQFLTGSVPVKLYATRLPVEGKVLGDDNLSITIDFANGSCGNILYTALGDKNLPKEYIEIFGDQKSAIINDFKGKGLLARQDKGHFEELDLFAQAILKSQESPIPFDELVLSTLATFKIIESLQTEEPVQISLEELTRK